MNRGFKAVRRSQDYGTGDQMFNLHGAVSIDFQLITAVHKCWSIIVRFFHCSKLGKSKLISKKIVCFLNLPAILLSPNCIHEWTLLVCGLPLGEL